MATIAPTRIAGFVLAFCVSLPLLAQTVTPADPGTTRFTDPQYGVTFRYPASWKFTTVPQFYSIDAPLTQPAPQSGRGLSARAIIVAHRAVWPELKDRTDFSGAEFIFNVLPGATPAACLEQMHAVVSFDQVDSRPIDGVPFSHTETGSAGLCHQVSESLYFGQAQGSCYVFDLAIHTVCPPEDEKHFSTRTDLHPVQDQLRAILATVRFGPQLHPEASAKHP
jgi:hypothetical protein